MKKRITINGLWRFYEETNGISGITTGETKQDAISNATLYLCQYFDDLYITDYFKIKVWEIEKDDDYHDATTIATNY